MAIVTETFNATPTGWTQIRPTSGGVGLSQNADNTGAARSFETNESFRRNFDTGGLSQFSECDVPSNGSDANRSLFLYARVPVNGSTNFYALFINANAGTSSILRYSNATTAAQITGISNYSYPTTNFKVRLEVTRSGTTDTLRGFINGTQFISSTYAASSTTFVGQACGLAFYNCGTANPPPLRVDNWRAGLLTDPLPVDGPELGRGLLAV